MCRPLPPQGQVDLRIDNALLDKDLQPLPLHPSHLLPFKLCGPAAHTLHTFFTICINIRPVRIALYDKNVVRGHYAPVGFDRELTTDCQPRMNADAR